MRRPLVSVLLPVYNGAKYLKEAIESILQQTYDNFEFIIINDGSTDNSADIIQQYKDQRIRFFDQPNQGLANALNRGVSLARGEYIARQDADDISLPRRFEKQVEFLEAHQECGLVGTWAVIWEANRETNRFHKHPIENLILQFDLLLDNPFVHSSVMLRKTVFDKVGYYSAEKARQPEDYELWSRVARKFQIANIPEVLQVYREVKGSICRTGENPFLDRVVNLSAENLAWTLGRQNPDQDLYDLSALAHQAFHRVSPKPNYWVLRDILIQAADRLSGCLECSREVLRKRAEEHLINVRYHYLRHRFGDLPGRALNLLERKFKRLITGESRYTRALLRKS